MLVISHNLRKVAEFLIFAADLTKEQIMDIFEKLHEITKEPSNFDPNAKEPLTFSDKGFKAIKSVSSLPLNKTADNTLYKVVMRIIDAIKLSEDRILGTIHNYLTTGSRIHLSKPITGDFEKVRKDMVDRIKGVSSGMDIITPEHDRARTSDSSSQS